MAGWGWEGDLGCYRMAGSAVMHGGLRALAVAGLLEPWTCVRGGAVGVYSCCGEWVRMRVGRSGVGLG